ncbi:SAM-dependent methyltransferase [Mycobacteroides saopaulense]|uniref:S-adenosyl-L-methionine-dependent methyltransferase n=1 Tax=Mycobacteroides saopaulense TaxID=1578165 RepID=A0ABX3C2B5_9MYCO|nr:SAM-dependent methyltransferase [Mycobacteroides saopaulense]OHT85095.1 SAM-dependent methyltransferase [Mycobacteroides saopaulense]OHU11246.1 SAM-dependent methyltransferase [Mycobacteroides saopaulense]
MVRTDGDTWDIVTSVGYTALAVAAARALDARLDPPLAHDDYAAQLVLSAGEPGLVASVTSGVMSDYVALNAQRVGVRTRFFDNFFADAAGAGVRQVVILAAGLDVRAYRLPWPAVTTVFELDQPQVLEFKDRVLRAAGAGPKAERVTVAADLRGDWPIALLEAGFDAQKPTAWALEGLLHYLPGTAQDLLFERLHELSPRGSRMAVELGPEPGELEEFATSVETIFDTSKDGGRPPYPRDLWFDDPRADSRTWLTEHGWTVTAADLMEAAASYGRPFRALPPILENVMRTKFFTAVRDR